MTDRERFQNTFSHLHASADTLAEVQRKMQKNKAYALRPLLTAAAVIAALAALAVTALAFDFFGIRALLRSESVGKTELLTVENGEPALTTPLEGGALSMTQPQEVPEAFRERAERQRAALDEWTAYCQNAAEPRIEDDGRGNFTLTWPDGTVETMDLEAFEAWYTARDAYTMTDYNGDYQVHTPAMAAKLEEIAARYGLSLRDQGQLRMSYIYGHTGEMYATGEELTALMERELGRGPILKEAPEYWDKLYWFNTGAFTMSAAIPGVPGSAGEDPGIYVRFTPWDELAPAEPTLDIRVADVNAVTARTHTAPDGTEVTILTDGGRTIFYAFLDRGFLVADTWEWTPVTGEGADYLADFFTYTNMGK